MPLLSEPDSKVVPLCVDLDGTLIRTDLLWESVVLAAVRHPRFLVQSILGARDRSEFKARLASKVVPAADTLPYNEELLEWLLEQRKQGRGLVLATASHERVADAVAEHLGIFDEVIATQEGCNLRSDQKRQMLQAKFPNGYDYAGNSKDDVPVWETARRIIVVDAPKHVENAIRRKSDIQATFERPSGAAAVWLRALRVHQWAKNLLLFVPLLASHQIFDFGQFAGVFAMFAAFSMCASALYLFNDLLDLESDRRHAHKKNRPLASGAISIPAGIAGVLVLLSSAFGMAAVQGMGPLGLVLLYGALSASYSLWLKRHAPVDVFFLAGLYTMRVVAGAVVTDTALSGWLITFTLFVFLGLAFCKRSSELQAASASKRSISGRGYSPQDVGIVTVSGICCAFTSALVLALYINAPQVQLLYRVPEFLWGVVPILLYWDLRIWLLATRGQMHHDPVLFAVRDRVTHVVIALILGIGAVSAHGVGLR